MRRIPPGAVLSVMMLLLLAGVCAAQTELGGLFDPGALKPTDSVLKVKVGDVAPDFTLPAITGEKVTLSNFRGRKNVILSFVPAAFTPVCSEQWPAYNLGRELIEAQDAVVIGISTDNTPAQFTWCRSMGGVWFPVVSDFFPHGATAKAYGVLRGEGVSERAEIIVDKKGVIRWIKVHDINERPNLEILVNELGRLEGKD